MAKNEKTSPEVASIASRGLRDPASLTNEEIKKVCGSVLTQAPDKNPIPDLTPGKMKIIPAKKKKRPR